MKPLEKFYQDIHSHNTEGNKMKSKTYRVMITYGTWNYKIPYVNGRTWDQAQALRQAAIGLGYADAEIEEEASK